MPTIDPRTRSSTADPVAALLARLSRGRKANQPGAFGGKSKANRAIKPLTLWETAIPEQP